MFGVHSGHYFALWFPVHKPENHSLLQSVLIVANHLLVIFEKKPSLLCPYLSSLATCMCLLAFTARSSRPLKESAFSPTER